MPLTNVTPLVSVDRGRFLQQNEAKIRSAASNALAASAKRDYLLENAFNALLYCEDFQDRHEVAAIANRNANRNPLADDHDRFVEKAKQLKLRTLDQLCHLVGF